jgi:integrase
MLTDRECRAALCPPDRNRLRLSDGQGLYLECAPSGSKRWFWKFYKDGKESRLALGRYPDITLKAARTARDEARIKHRTGTDPLQARRLEKIAARSQAGGSFAEVAREYHAIKSPSWSPKYAERWLRQVDKDLFPWIGSLDLRQITAPVLLDALRRVERRGVNELAHSLRQAAGQVLRYGVQTGRCDRSPAADLHGALRPVRTQHMAALTDPADVGRLMRAIDGYNGQPTTRALLMLSALLFQRPGNMRAMQWAHISGDLWTIPAAEMKRTLAGKDNGRPHLVPLAPQALAALDDVRRHSGLGQWVFPALHTSKRCASENTALQALRRMGFGPDEMTPHGFRATARTLLSERLGVHQDVIEAQLAHVKSGPLGAAYDRAEFLTQRRAMMCRWADYLDELASSARTTSDRQ